MNESEIQKLEGTALLRAFHKASYTRVLGDDSDPLVVIDPAGNIQIFTDDALREPQIYVMDTAKQLVAALQGLQVFNPHFEATEDCEKVYCTLGGAQAIGEDYFEAAMRAYLLFELRKKNIQK